MANNPQTTVTSSTSYGWTIVTKPIDEVSSLILPLLPTGNGYQLEFLGYLYEIMLRLEDAKKCYDLQYECTKEFELLEKSKEWEGPTGALTIVGNYGTKYSTENQNFSYRTKDWRYIVYSNGKEELYNNNIDPKEWDNLLFNRSHPKRDEMVVLLKEMTYPVIPNGLKLVNKH
jgi:hypothetical protein